MEKEGTGIRAFTECRYSLMSAGCVSRPGAAVTLERYNFIAVVLSTQGWNRAVRGGATRRACRLADWLLG